MPPAREAAWRAPVQSQPAFSRAEDRFPRIQQNFPGAGGRRQVLPAQASASPFLYRAFTGSGAPRSEPAGEQALPCAGRSFRERAGRRKHPPGMLRGVRLRMPTPRPASSRGRTVFRGCPAERSWNGRGEQSGRPAERTDPGLYRAVPSAALSVTAGFPMVLPAAPGAPGSRQFRGISGIPAQRPPGQAGRSEDSCYSV